MSCDREESTVLLAAGLLETGEKFVVESHLKTCPDCTRAFQDAQQLHQTLASHESARADRSFAERTMRQIRQLPKVRSPKASASWDSYEWIAAAGAVFAGAITLLFWVPGLKETLPSFKASPATGMDWNWLILPLPLAGLAWFVASTWADLGGLPWAKSKSRDQ